jgi:hypothetical protein
VNLDIVTTRQTDHTKTMPCTFEEATNCLEIRQPLYGPVIDEIKYWGTEKQIYVLGSSMFLGSSMSCLVLDHTDDDFVIKITVCQATYELFNRLLRQGPVPGLPEVIAYYGECGISNVTGNNDVLHAFKLKKYRNNVRTWGGAENKEKCDSASNISFAACNKGYSTSKESIVGIDKLLSSLSNDVSVLNFQQALIALRQFFEAHDTKSYFFELPSNDWFLDGAQPVNVDPVGDTSRF